MTASVALKAAARKHKVEVMPYLLAEQFTARLQDLNNSDARLVELKQAVDDAEISYCQAAQASARRAAASVWIRLLKLN